MLSIAAFFTGVSRGAFTAVVMLVEMTGAWEFVAPLAVCALTARFVSVRICRHVFYSEIAANLNAAPCFKGKAIYRQG